MAEAITPFLGVPGKLFFVGLDATEPPLEPWWLSVHGIYRPCPQPERPLPSAPVSVERGAGPTCGEGVLLHHKYLLPASCFAYVGAADLPATWKLPYLLADGSPGLKRLPKAVQAILSNCRGVKVMIPREADVLLRLARTAAGLKEMRCQCSPAAEVNIEAHEALDRLGRLLGVGCCS